MHKKLRGNKDVLKIIFEFQKRIVQNKPTLEKMYDEVRMMHFKIRPLQGDVSLLNLADSRLIETLWNLGKLDELFRRQNHMFSEEEKEIFLRFFDSLHTKFQKELSKIKLVSSEALPIPSTIEMEIFREETAQKKLN